MVCKGNVPQQHPYPPPGPNHFRWGPTGVWECQILRKSFTSDSQREQKVSEFLNQLLEIALCNVDAPNPNFCTPAMIFSTRSNHIGHRTERTLPQCALVFGHCSINRSGHIRYQCRDSGIRRQLAQLAVVHLPFSVQHRYHARESLTVNLTTRTSHSGGTRCSWGNVCPAHAWRATFLLTIPTSARDLPSDGEGPPNRP